MTRTAFKDESRLLAALFDEVLRQDEIHPSGFPSTRDGLRLGIAALEDETREARESHRLERRSDGWPDTRGELLQAMAVCFRMIRSIDRGWVS